MLEIMNNIYNLPQFNKPNNVMTKTDSQHYESQRERDETKYLRQIEVPMLQLETTVKGGRFASLNVYSY